MLIPDMKLLDLLFEMEGGYVLNFSNATFIAQMLPVDVAPMVLGESESMTLCGVEGFAVDPLLAQRLWKMSEALSEMSLPI